MKTSAPSFKTLFRTGAFSVFAWLALLRAVPTQAAMMSVSSGSAVIRPGDTFTVDVRLATDDESVNAIEGGLAYPPGRLRLESIKDGGSFVSFWILRPHAEDPGKIAFAGITPGGYAGSAGLIFSAVFRSVSEGQAHLALTDARALLNDGEGTAVPLTLTPLDVTSASGSPPITRVLDRDEAPPETFTPKVAQDPHVLDGKWFVAFGTQDKGSGIDHYEIREVPQNGSPASPWSSATSPYPLTDQGLRSRIDIRAVDKEGNVQLASVSAAVSTPWYVRSPAWRVFAFGLLAIAVALLLRFRRKRAA